MEKLVRNKIRTHQQNNLKLKNTIKEMKGLADIKIRCIIKN